MFDREKITAQGKPQKGGSSKFLKLGNGGASKATMLTVSALQTPG